MNKKHAFIVGTIEKGHISIWGLQKFSEFLIQYLIDRLMSNQPFFVKQN